MCGDADGVYADGMVEGECDFLGVVTEAFGLPWGMLG